jgi:hypothetical protein
VRVPTAVGADAQLTTGEGARPTAGFAAATHPEFVERPVLRIVEDLGYPFASAGRGPTPVVSLSKVCIIF